MKIPKIIHYCWFGNNPKSELIERCINSWRKYAPEYEIIEWNENNFDINKYNYTKQAYIKKKFAFVSDVVRFDVLYEMGGIYLDTDVELLKNIDFLLEENVFFGYDQKRKIAPGLIMGAQPKQAIIREILAKYSNTSFLLPSGIPNMTTVVTIISDILETKGIILDGKFYKNDKMTIYPADFFDPYDIENSELLITKNTISIHHYAASWKSNGDMIIYKIGKCIKKIVGMKMYEKLARVKHKLIG